MFSTAMAMGKWIIALLNNQLIRDDKNIETMWKPVKLNNGKKGIVRILKQTGLAIGKFLLKF